MSAGGDDPGNSDRYADKPHEECDLDLLTALAREQPQLYAELGQAFVTRREV